MKNGVIVLSVCLIVVSGCCNSMETFEITNLKCEYLNNPTAIDKTEPRFNWNIIASRNGAEQSAYQILVASNKKLLEEEKADCWNSGKINSGQSILVAYHGKQQ